MDRSVVNLHNHTPFSDGALSIDELCEAHLKLPGVKVEAIGICDTLFCTPTSRPIENERQFQQLFRSEAREYVNMVQQARRHWQGRIHLFCGCEIHWNFNKTMLGSVRQILAELEIDYVMFSGLDWAGLTQLANQARTLQRPVGLARTDVGSAFPNTPMEQVVRTMANARIFWELTPDQFAQRLCDPWCNVLQGHKVRVAVGTDTHDDDSCLKSLKGMYDYLDAKKLTDKIFIPEPRRVMAEAASA